MHLPLLTVFTTLGITIAVPVYSTPSPSSTRLLTPTSHHAAATPLGAYQCPPRQYKACCQSVQQTSKGIMQNLGEILPILGGVQISSQLSFQCNNMAPNQSPNSCDAQNYAPMCCSNTPGNGGFNMCKPFKEAKDQYYRTFGYGGESQVDMINEAVS